ncbi:MAG: hypothetical protein ACRYF7_10425 [Janthinobacterium lividum]|uniref:hypothetical protein n=1 Tax=Massilia yuzhufengensis TaxID=1164594 RepID=UPI000B89A8D1|nr:hypothetical protein [Massilia yuzhufengensis]
MGEINYLPRFTEENGAAGDVPFAISTRDSSPSVVLAAGGQAKAMKVTELLDGAVRSRAICYGSMILDITLTGMFVARSCTGVACRFTCGAMCMLVSMRCTRRRTCPANMCTERTEITVMLRSASQRIHGCATNIGAIEIDQGAIGCATFANVSRSTRLGCMDSFFTCLDTGLQVVFVHFGSLHMVSIAG